MPFLFCEECGPIVHLINRVTEEFPHVKVHIKAGFNSSLTPLGRAGWHRRRGYYQRTAKQSGPVPDGDELRRALMRYGGSDVNGAEDA